MDEEICDMTWIRNLQLNSVYVFIIIQFYFDYKHYLTCQFKEKIKQIKKRTDLISLQELNYLHYAFVFYTLMIKSKTQVFNTLMIQFKTQVSNYQCDLYVFYHTKC